MTKDFEALKRRVEVVRGSVTPVTLAGGLQFLMVRLSEFKKPVWVAASNEGMEFITGYLDGLDAQARARRCVKTIDKQASGTVSGDFDMGRQRGLRTAAAVIRGEFGIKEEK